MHLTSTELVSTLENQDAMREQISDQQTELVLGRAFLVERAQEATERAQKAEERAQKESEERILAEERAQKESEERILAEERARKAEERLAQLSSQRNN
jgi:hypothetical protein